MASQTNMVLTNNPTTVIWGGVFFVAKQKIKGNTWDIIITDRIKMSLQTDISLRRLP